MKKITSNFLVGLSMFVLACGPIEEASDEGQPVRVQVSASAPITWLVDRSQIEIDLDSKVKSEADSSLGIDCIIDFETELLEFTLSESANALTLNELELKKSADIEAEGSIEGIDSRIFAVWQLEPIIRGAVKETIRIRLEPSRISYINECQLL